MSVLDPLTCGFAKVLLYNILTEPHNMHKQESEPTKNFKGRILEMQYTKFQEHFRSENFDVSYTCFKDNFPNIVANIRGLNKRHSVTKDEIFHIFSYEIWMKLSEDRKRKHSLHDCKGCLGNHSFKRGLSMFPFKQTN